MECTSIRRSLRVYSDLCELGCFFFFNNIPMLLLDYCLYYCKTVSTKETFITLTNNSVRVIHQLSAVIQMRAPRHKMWSRELFKIFVLHKNKEDGGISFDLKLCLLKKVQKSALYGLGQQLTDGQFFFTKFQLK